VTDDRNLGLHKLANHFDAAASAFELHCFRPAFFEVADRRFNGASGLSVISAERKVNHQQGATHSASHGFQMVQHLVDGHRDGGVVAEHSLSQAVAHQNRIDSGFVHQSRCGVIVGGQAGDTLAAQLSVEYIGDGHFAHGLKIRVHGILLWIGGQASGSRRP